MNYNKALVAMAKKLLDEDGARLEEMLTTVRENHNNDFTNKRPAVICNLTIELNYIFTDREVGTGYAFQSVSPMINYEEIAILAEYYYNLLIK
jgi:hypothetical protein